MKIAAFFYSFFLSFFVFPSSTFLSFSFIPAFIFLFSFFLHRHSRIPFCLLCLYTPRSSFTFYFISPFSTFPPLYISSFVIHALSFSPTTSISCEIQIASIGDASFARPAIVPDDGVSAYEKVSTRLNCLL